MKYKKPIMKMSELKSEMGFPVEFLMCAYRWPGQTFASKINPTKANSAIMFDTAGLEAWRLKQVELENRTMPRGR